MKTRGLATAVVTALALSGCMSEPESPSPSPTTTPVPAGVQEFLDATAAGDLDFVRAHLRVWNEDAGRYLVASEISTQCAEDEVTAVALKANSPNLTAYVYTGTEPWILRFERSDGSSEGWGIENHDGVWFWQPQAASCLDLWSSPSPSPS